MKIVGVFLVGILVEGDWRIGGSWERVEGFLYEFLSVICGGFWFVVFLLFFVICLSSSFENLCFLI